MSSTIQSFPSISSLTEKVLQGQIVSKQDFLYALNEKALSSIDLFSIFVLSQLLPEYADFTGALEEPLQRLLQKKDLSEMDKAISGLIVGKLDLEVDVFQNSEVYDVYFENAVIEGLYATIFLILRAEVQKSSKLLKVGLYNAQKINHLITENGEFALSYLISEEGFSEDEVRALCYVVALLLKKYEQKISKETSTFIRGFSADLFSMPSPMLQLLLRYLEKFFPQLTILGQELQTPYHIADVNIFETSGLWASFSTKGNQTGIGSVFRKEGIMITSMGPYRSPIGERERFGIETMSNYTEHRKELYSEKETICYESWSQLTSKEDVWSLDWVWLQGQFSQESIKLKVHFELDEKQSKDAIFAFFCKGRQLEIGSKKTILPKSLDRFCGATETLQVSNEKFSWILKANFQGSMEVIPLGGGDDFWSGDFLIAYFMDDPSNPMLWEIKTL